MNANGTMRERDDHTYGGVRHVHIEGVNVVAYDSTVHLPRMHTPVDDTQRMPKKRRSRTGKNRQDIALEITPLASGCGRYSRRIGK